VTFVRNRVCDNDAESGPGGGVWIGANVASTSSVTNNFIVENRATTSGGGLFVGDASVGVRNNHVLGNVAAPASGGGIRLGIDGIAARNNLVGGQTAGNGLSRSAGPGSVVTYGAFYGNVTSDYDIDGAGTVLPATNFTVSPALAYHAHARERG
jgi:hypothetical protein